MSTVITQLGTIAENLASGFAGAVNWTNPGRALTPDNLSASVAFSATNLVSNFLYVHGLSLSIPDTAVIEGIQVAVKRSAVGPVLDNYVGLIFLDTGTPTITAPGKQLPSNWSTTNELVNYGGPGDLWGRGWTAADFNDTAFGFGLAAAGDGSLNNAATVDYVQITIYYHQLINQTTTGGGVVGGSTTVTSFGAAPLQGGSALAAGHATTNFDIVPTGGLYASGLSVNAHGLYARGGAFANGAAPFNAVFRPSSQGGVILSGRWPITDTVRITAAGVLAAGTAPVLNTYLPTGGVLGAGSAAAAVKYQTPTSGGGFAAGLAVVDPYVMSGGVKGAGAATAAAKYAITAAGGAKGGGTASVLNTFPTSGGLLAAGAAVRISPFVASGGLLAAGDPVVKPYAEEGHGGVSVAPLSFVDPYPAFGGMVAGGAAAHTMVMRSDLAPNTYSFYCTVWESVPQFLGQNRYGVVFARLDPTNHRFFWEIRHDFQSADIVEFRGPAAPGDTGSLILKLETLGSTASPIVGSMAVTVQQQADILAGLWYLRIRNNTVPVEARGQVAAHPSRTSSTAGLFVERDEVSSGGAVAAGAATLLVRHVYATSGGAFAAGAAPASVTQGVSGGAFAAGTAVVRFVGSTSATGGAQGSAPATTKVVYRPAVSGGAFAAGAAVRIDQPLVGGGAFAAGSAGRAVGWIMAGGAKAAGQAANVEIYTSRVGVGGLRIYGSWLGEKAITVVASPHRGYGLLMKSSNILNAPKPRTNAIINSQAKSQPLAASSPFALRNQAGWCEFGGSCARPDAYLPKVVQKRQGVYLPPKHGVQTQGDDQVVLLS